MRKPLILDSQNEKQDALSTLCPLCGCSKILKGELGGHDFDENGWFQIQHFQCQDPKCLHKWTNKVVIASGGTTYKHAI